MTRIFLDLKIGCSSETYLEVQATMVSGLGKGGA